MSDPRPPEERARLEQIGATTPASPPPPPIAWRHYLWIAGAALVVLLALHWLGPVLTPFLVGAIFAYLGLPLVTRLQRRRVPRSVGALLVIVIFAIVLTALFVVLIPLVQAEATTASHKLPELFATAMAQLSPWVEQHLGITLAFDAQSVRDYISNNTDDVRAMSLRVLSGVKTGGLIVVTLLVNAALIPVVMFYLLRDWNLILERVLELVPRRWDERTVVVARAIDNVLAEFLHGQLSVMVVLALYYSIALSVVGLEHALPIGILTGLLVFIPYVGFGLGLTLGMIAALLQWSGWPGFLAVAAVYGVGQLLENYVLVPYLVGDRIGLHPLAVIFALLAFGTLFGFAGVLLALPVSAALLVGLRELRGAYVASPIYRKD
ncbi:MAG: AI-2E family transporter [Casimicrobiaceae bacterium]